ncbi:MAG: nitroreductase family protein [Cyanobacteria bacterium P01_F01_bin.116]
MSSMNPEAVAAAIKERKTLKVLGDADTRVKFTDDIEQRNRPLILESLQVAGWAPFHFARGKDDLAEPWRAHVLWHQDSQKLADNMFEWFPELDPANKLTRMMYACGALILVTWLPQFAQVSDPKPEQIIIDKEHLAASSAMVQNLLLMLTAHEMGSYWSSGGKLGSDVVFDKIGISRQEQLLAAVFVEYPETQDETKPRLPGKHRNSRSTMWIRELSVQ